MHKGLIKLLILFSCLLSFLCCFATPMKILVLIPEKQNDHSFSEAAFDGLQKAIADNKNLYDVKYLLNVDALSPQEQLNLINRYYQQGYKAVVGTGEEYANIMSKAAGQYKEGRFATIGCKVKPNIHNFCLDNSPFAGRLAGIVAGVLTRTGKIGYIGGEKNVENTLYAAYQNAAESINPNIVALVNWNNDWNNLNSAKALATQQIQAGADVIFSVSNIGPTLASENTAKKVRVIGWMSNQNSIAPNTVATSVIVDFSKVYSIVFKTISAPNFTSGITAITDNSVWSLAPFGKNVTSVEKALIEKRLRAILDR